MLENYSDVLDVKDICEVLKVGRVKAYQLLNKGEIPHRRIGRHYRIRKDAVIEYLKQTD